MSAVTPRATEQFYRQHAVLGRLAAAVLRELDQGVEARAEPAQRALARLAGHLRIHAAMEDDALYPRLLDHPDAGVRATASRFAAEFGAAYGRLLDLRERWTTEAIAAAPDTFVEETRAVLSQLSIRIQRENAELYPLVDRLFPASSTPST